MKKIDNSARTKISHQISEVEKSCESELVCLITQRSARYVLFPLLIAAFIALIFPVLQPFANMLGADGITLTFQYQTVLFLVLAALFVFTPLRHKLTPKWLKQQNCDRYSREQFFGHHLHETTSRNAILIFVSWDERFVTVVADKGINERVQQGDWDQLIAGFIADIRNDDVEKGFLRIIRGAGDLLIKHFPSQTPKQDALPNHLLEPAAPDYLS